MAAVIPLDLALALVLLLTPAEVRPAELDLAETGAVRPLMQALALHLEILDPREAHHVLARPLDLDADLRMLHLRLAELRDAPPLHDAQALPDRQTINDLLAFNRDYRCHADRLRLRGFHDRWALRETLLECDRLYQIWDAARDARCDYYYVTVRRAALRRLQEMLGYAAYCSGAWPPAVPLAGFQRLR